MVTLSLFIASIQLVNVVLLFRVKERHLKTFEFTVGFQQKRVLNLKCVIRVTIQQTKEVNAHECAQWNTKIPPFATTHCVHTGEKFQTKDVHKGMINTKSIRIIKACFWCVCVYLHLTPPFTTTIICYVLRTVHTTSHRFSSNYHDAVNIYNMYIVGDRAAGTNTRTHQFTSIPMDHSQQVQSCAH